MAIRLFASYVRIPWKTYAFSPCIWRHVLPIERSFKSLTLSVNPSVNLLQRGKSLLPFVAASPLSVLRDAQPKKKRSSAEKSARKSAERRLRNRARKSEIKTRMRRVFKALDQLKMKTDAKVEEILPVDELISNAYRAIDKAVSSGTIHRNTAARRKSRLARRKKSVEIHHGWYIPAAESV